MAEEGIEGLPPGCPPEDQCPPPNFIVEWKVNEETVGYVLVEKLVYFPNNLHGVIADPQKTAFQNKFAEAACMLRAVPLDKDGRVKGPQFHFVTNKSGTGPGH